MELPKLKVKVFFYPNSTQILPLQAQSLVEAQLGPIMTLLIRHKRMRSEPAAGWAILFTCLALPHWERRSQADRWVKRMAIPSTHCTNHEVQRMTATGCARLSSLPGGAEKGGADSGNHGPADGTYRMKACTECPQEICLQKGYCMQISTSEVTPASCTNEAKCPSQAIAANRHEQDLQ